MALLHFIVPAADEGKKGVEATGSGQWPDKAGTGAHDVAGGPQPMVSFPSTEPPLSADWAAMSTSASLSWAWARTTEASLPFTSTWMICVDEEPGSVPLAGSLVVFVSRVARAWDATTATPALPQRGQ